MKSISCTSFYFHPSKFQAALAHTHNNPWNQVLAPIAHYLSLRSVVGVASQVSLLLCDFKKFDEGYVDPRKSSHQFCWRWIQLTKSLLPDQKLQTTSRFETK